MDSNNAEKSTGEGFNGRTSVGWTGGLDKSLSKQLLLDHFGLACWGCGFEPPKRYNNTQDVRLLQLDHIRPKQPPEGKAGSDELYNLAILCPPCNIAKSNDQTLEQLRKDNGEKGFLYVGSVDHLTELDEREHFAIRMIFEREENGETKKTLQHIFRMTIRANGTVSNPSTPDRES